MARNRSGLNRGTKAANLAGSPRRSSSGQGKATTVMPGQKTSTRSAAKADSGKFAKGV